MHSVYAILSGKGGVGKTTLAANLGIGLASLGKKTLVVDGDIAAGNLALHFGLGRLEKTLHDLLSGDRKIEGAIYKTSGGKLDFLPSGLSLKGFLRSDVTLFPRLLKKFGDEYEIVLVDTPPGISRDTLIPTRASDKILLVTTPDRPSISATLKAKAIATLLDREIVGLVINRFKKSSIYGGKVKTELEQELGTKILGVIPEDENVWKSVDLGKPVVIGNPKTPASKALLELSGILAGEPRPELPEKKKPKVPEKEKPEVTKPPTRKLPRFFRRR